MGREKHEKIEREEAEYRLAERDGRGCPHCGAVIPYGTDVGEYGECPACVGALKDD